MSSVAPSKLGILGKMAAGVVIPSIPVAMWWHSARQDRQRQTHNVRTKVRVPNVQTIDDLMVEKCRPGDILLFDRKCEKCAAGPVAALSCLASRGLLCREGDARRRMETGKFDHCGIVVPGYSQNKAQELDPSNLMLLEATSGDGVVARPLLTRLEMSQSRSVMLLPLSSPGERRYDEDDDTATPDARLVRTREYTRKQFTAFRDKWVRESKERHYESAHGSLGVIGAMLYALHLPNPGPTSPSAWIVVSALQQAGIAEHLKDRTAMETKVEDFLRDHRFHETETVRLRPGFKFLAPVTMRETSRS